MSKVQNTESLVFIPGGASYPTETAELLLVAFRAWAALWGPSVNLRGAAIFFFPSLRLLLLPRLGKQDKGTWKGARLFPRGEMQQSWAGHLKTLDDARIFSQFLFCLFLQIPS